VPQEDRRPPDVRRDVWGKRIDAICSPVIDPRKVRRSAVRETRLWPRGQLELSYRFSRDISDRVKWCLLEDGGLDVAGVMFVRFIRVYGNSADDRRAGRRLRRHIRREAASAPWLPRVRDILVADGVVTISTDLARSARSRRIATRLCDLLWSSGVGERPAGKRLPHAVFGRDDTTVRTCRRPSVSPGS
jgi:hypothetical protein